MVMKPWSLWLVCLLLVPLAASLTPNTFLDEADKQRFLELFSLKGFFSPQTLVNTYYSALGLSVLSNEKPAAAREVKESKDQVCNHLKTVINEGNNLENVYLAFSASKIVGCQATPSGSVLTWIESHLKEGSTVSELHRAAMSLLNAGRTLDALKLSKLLSGALKGDESLLSVGLAFQLASKFTAAEHMAPFVDKIGDVIIQADEVDGKYLQFEGGLGVTASIINGIYSLATASKKPTGLTEEQATKFANYFLNRKSVQTIKGAAELLEVLYLYTDNKYHIPVCISIYGSSALSPSKPVISVRVTNVLGKSLSQQLSLTAESSSWTGKKTLSPVQGDSTLFALNFLENKPKRGPHNISLTVNPGKVDPRLVGNKNAQIKVTLMTEVVVENPEIGVADRDQATSFKTTQLKYPSYSEGLLEADYQQKVILKFSLKDKLAGDSMTAHQVFIQMINQETKQEIVFVAEPETVSNIVVYKFDLNVAARAKDFGHNSGKYTLSLIVGDAVISNPFTWKLITVKLTFPSTGAPEGETVKGAPWLSNHYGLKPEIKHMFREPDKRPAPVISDAFTVLTALPLLLLLGLWAKLGVNFSNFPFALSTIIFHASLGSIFGLFFMFWLKLNMFTTVKCLLGLSVITFLSGHSLLSRLASSREKK